METKTCALLLLCLFSLVSFGAGQDLSGGIDVYGGPAKPVSGQPLLQLSPETGLVPLDKIQKPRSTSLVEVYSNGTYVRKTYNVSKEEALELWKASGNNADVCCICICENVPYAAKRTSYIGGFSAYPERIMALLPSLWSWSTPFLS